MPPTGFTRVVTAKVHSLEPRFNWAAATAADELTAARDSVLAVPLLPDAGGVPRQLPKFPIVIGPEPRLVMFFVAIASRMPLSRPATADA